MTKEKVDVYKDESVVADMVERYTAVVGDNFTDEDRANVVAKLAEELGKPKASVRAKLVREGVYVAKTNKTKTGAPIVSKAKMVDNIASTLGVTFTDGEGTSLEKATKTTLKKIFEAIEDLHDEIDGADIPEPEEDAANDMEIEDSAESA